MEEKTKKALKYVFWGVVVLVILGIIAHCTGLVNIKELYEKTKAKVKESLENIFN